MPRSSEYTEEVAARICAEIASGRSLRSICEGDEFPTATTVFKWLSQQPAFAEQYSRACEARTAFMAEEILEISDDGTGDSYTDEDGIVHTNNEIVQRSKLRVESRKWLMSKMAPKKYGERLDLNVAGTLQTATDETLDARIAQLLGKAGAAAASGGTAAPEEPE